MNGCLKFMVTAIVAVVFLIVCGPFIPAVLAVILAIIPLPKDGLLPILVMAPIVFLLWFAFRRND